MGECGSSLVEELHDDATGRGAADGDVEENVLLTTARPRSANTRRTKETLHGHNVPKAGRCRSTPRKSTEIRAASPTCMTNPCRDLGSSRENSSAMHPEPATTHRKTVSNLTHACSSLSDLHGGHGRPGVLTVGILSRCEVSDPLPLFKIKRVL